MLPIPTTPRKKHNVLSSLLFGKKSQNSTNKGTNKLSAVGVVEELFEEGSAMLTERSLLVYNREIYICIQSFIVYQLFCFITNKQVIGTKIIRVGLLQAFLVFIFTDKINIREDIAEVFENEYF